MLNRYNLTFIIFTTIAFIIAKLLHNSFFESNIILLIFVIASFIFSKYDNNLHSSNVPIYILSIIGSLLISFTILNQFRVIKIDSERDFLKIYNNLDGKYMLTDNISLDELNFYDWDHYSYYDGCFEGDLDGNNYTINDLTVPLFRCVGSENGKGVIKNLKITSSETIDAPYIFGFRNNGLISNITLNVNLKPIKSSNYVGSIVSKNDIAGVIENVNFNGRIEAITYVGGIVSENAGTINNVYVDGFLLGRDVGGIVSINKGEIKNSEVQAELSSTFQAAGIAAYNHNTIKNCYIGANFKKVNDFNYGVSFNEDLGGYTLVENCIINLDNNDELVLDGIYLIGNTTRSSEFKNILIYTDKHSGPFNILSNSYNSFIENVYYSNSLNILDEYGVSINNDVLNKSWYQTNLNLPEDNWDFNNKLPRIKFN